MTFKNVELSEPLKLGKAKTIKLMRKKANLLPYIWITPALLVLGSILFYPWVWSFWLSFYFWSPLRPGAPKFVGFSNYLSVFMDKRFQLALYHSLLLVAGSVSVQFLLGFGIALLLTRAVRARGFLLTAFMIPMMLTRSIVGLVWKIWYHGEWGLLNYLLSLISISKVGWLSDPSMSLISVIIIQIWLHTPFVTLVLFAGLQALPIEPFEAARIDGASSAQMFWYITLPFLRPLIVIVLLFRTMFAFRAFDVIYSLFRSGGPGKGAMVLGVYLYETFRLTWKLGLSAAISIILLGLTVLLTLGFTTSLYKRVEE